MAQFVDEIFVDKDGHIVKIEDIFPEIKLVLLLYNDGLEAVESTL